MSAVWMRLRAETRARWRAWVGLALVAGLAGGLVTAAAAGARRTQTAYERMLATTSPHDVFLYQFSDVGLTELDPDAVVALPEVDEVARLSWFWADVGTPVGIAIPRDEKLGTQVDQAKIVSGRRADPDAPDEATASFAAADRYGISVGSKIPLFPKETPDDPPEVKRYREAFVAAGAPLELRVVGIQAGPYDLPPITIGSSIAAYATPSLYRIASKAQGLFQSSIDSISVRLKRGAEDLPAFERRLRGLAGPDSEIELEPLANTAASVRNAIAPLSTAMWLLAGILGLSSLVIVGQTLTRHIAVSSDDNGTLGALGMTPPEQWIVAMGRTLVIGVMAAGVAVVVAVALSPLTPLGIARVAEPSPGLHVDAFTIATAIAGMLIAVLLVSAMPAWRATSAGSAASDKARGSAAPNSKAVAAFARAGASVPAVAGVHMALSRGSGRASLPIRSTIFGISIAGAALAASLCVAASLHHLLQTPRLYGLTWDLQIVEFDADADFSVPAQTLSSDPGIAALSYGGTGSVAIKGRTAEAYAVTPIRGDAYPTIVDGRRPSAADEIALGARTLRTIGAEVGDRVDVSLLGAAERSMTIVGRVVNPALTQGELGESPLLDWFSNRANFAESDRLANTMLVRFAPGADIARLTGRIEDLIIPAEETAFVGLSDVVSPNETPRDVVNFGRVENLPIALSVALAALASAVLAHMIASSVRRRRHDLAILKTLGLGKGHIRAVVGWQATTLVVAALVVGIPVGVVGGRWAWTSLADRGGVVPAPRVPVAALALMMPAAILLANLVAAIPGRIAARTQPALVLRTE
ncbi:MAG: FtsX-like permease family protein [Actinomycetota bacterium]